MRQTFERMEAFIKEKTCLMFSTESCPYCVYAQDSITGQSVAAAPTCVVNFHFGGSHRFDFESKASPDSDFEHLTKRCFEDIDFSWGVGVFLDLDLELLWGHFS